MKIATKNRSDSTRFARLIRFLEFRIAHIDDSPHRIALAVAIGLFIAWTPAFGLHICLALILAFLFRANKFVAISCVWISNPFTAILIYYPNYFIGRALRTWFTAAEPLELEQVTSLFKNSLSISTTITGFFTIQFWQQIGSVLAQIGMELLIGGFVIGSIIAVASYFATYKLITGHRRKKPHRRFRHHL